MCKETGDGLAMEAASCIGKLAVAEGLITDLHKQLAEAKLTIQHLQARLTANESIVWPKEVPPTAHLAGTELNSTAVCLHSCMLVYSGTHAFVIDQPTTAVTRRLLSTSDGTDGELYASFTFVIIHQHIS